MKSFKLYKPEFYCWKPNIYDGIAILLCLLYVFLEFYLLPRTANTPNIYKMAVISGLAIPPNIYIFGMINLYSDACKYVERPQWYIVLLKNLFAPVILVYSLTPLAIWASLAILPILFSLILILLVMRTRHLLRFTYDKNVLSSTLISLAKNKDIVQLDIFFAKSIFGAIILNIVLFSDFA